MNSGARMLLQYRGLGGRISWDEGPLGARASRPHKSWHSLGHLHDLDQPGTVPWLDAVPSNRVEHRIEAQRRPSGERCRLPGSSMAKFARSARNRRGSMPQQEQGAGGTPALPGITTLPGNRGVIMAASRIPPTGEGCNCGGGGGAKGSFFSVNIDAQDAQD